MPKYVRLAAWTRSGKDDAGDSYQETIYKLPDGSEYEGPLYAEIEED